MRMVRFSGVVLLLAVLAGCAANNGRQPVSGTVTYRGEPLNNATVQFFAVEGPPGPLCGALITSGQFNIPAEHGLEPGTYKVSISMPVPGGEQTPEEKAAGASAKAKEGLPAKYNSATELRAEVKSGPANKFDFKLQ
ncbi:MAG: carboxypeptidase-like regulatory domain-containing protein [Gemmataceae bacterium]